MLFANTDIETNWHQSHKRGLVTQKSPVFQALITAVKATRWNQRKKKLSSPAGSHGIYWKENFTLRAIASCQLAIGRQRNQIPFAEIESSQHLLPIKRKPMCNRPGGLFCPPWATLLLPFSALWKAQGTFIYVIGHSPLCLFRTNVTILLLGEIRRPLVKGGCRYHAVHIWPHPRNPCMER